MSLSQFERFTKCLDFWEGTYYENYAGACTTVTLACDYHMRGNRHNLSLIDALIQRSLAQLQDPTVQPFCKTFIIHFTLLALLLLPEKERISFTNAYPTLLTFQDPCKVINMNCAAMQLGTELFLYSFGISNASAIQEKPSYLEANSLGFLNDSLHEAGMPIAYHAFIVYLLCEASYASILSNQSDIKLRIDKLINNGVNWMIHFEKDGHLAMTGRSRHQCFVPGIIAAIHSFCDIEFDLSYFDEYKKEDNTFSVTPNYFPNNLRVGFERYSHENMYNQLAMVGVSMAEVFSSTDFSPDISYSRISEHFIDYDSGYCSFKKVSNGIERFFAATLRDHNPCYTPGNAGFDYRIDSMPLPLAESNFFTDVWEGFYVKDEFDLHPLQFPDNCDVTPIRDGFTFNSRYNGITIHKSIEVTPTSIKWTFKLESSTPLNQVIFQLPILINDGRNSLYVYPHRDSTFNFMWKNRIYQLYCTTASRVELSLNRTFQNVYGAASACKFIIPPSDGKKMIFEGTVELVSVNTSSTGLQSLNLPGKGIYIDEICLSLSQDGLLSMTMDASGTALEYAWYIYKNGVKIHQQWYTSSSQYTYVVDDMDAEWKVLGFVRNSTGLKVSRLQVLSPK